MRQSREKDAVKAKWMVGVVTVIVGQVGRVGSTGEEKMVRNAAVGKGIEKEREGQRVEEERDKSGPLLKGVTAEREDEKRAVRGG